MFLSYLTMFSFLPKKVKPPIPDLAFVHSISRDLPAAHFYLVGGAVRDAILGRKSKDFDLVVSGVSFSILSEKLLNYGRLVFDLDPQADISKLSPSERENLFHKGFGVLKFFPRAQDQKISVPSHSDFARSLTCIDIALPRTDRYEKKSFVIDGIKRDVFAQADPNLPIADDLARRDFTINSMAVDIISGELIDPNGGLRDLKRRVIKTVGAPDQRILKEDLSRAFRGLRFANQLDFSIDPKTFETIKKVFQPATVSAAETYAHLDPSLVKKIIDKETSVKKEFNWPLKKNLPLCWQIFYDQRTDKIKTAVAPEIVSKELIKAIEANPVAFLDLWDQANALLTVFPEVSALHNIPQPPEFHSEGDAFAHTRLLLFNLPAKASLKLKLAGLLHDIGKPLTIKLPGHSVIQSKSSRIRFDGHAEVGSQMAEKALKRLKFPKNISAPVVWAIKNHMIALTSREVKLKNTTLEKYFFRPNGWGNLLLDLIYYDGSASLGPDGHAAMDCYQNIKFQIDALKSKLNFIKTQKGIGSATKPLITGHDLIKNHFIPGPKFKNLLDAARDYQLDHPTADKDEILNHLAQIT